MKYFTITELCASQKAKAYGINNHTISATVADNLIRLVDNVLDPLRKAYGKPITVSSGYRCEKLNRLVGGVTNSDHLLGMAADLDVGSKEENKKLFQLILKLKLPFKQLINEHNYDWVHVSFDVNNIKMQTLNL
ncbi:MAG: D-Ala-D-Ala carboxypeptidase family metallohydrolase [Bacteroidales bacterium]|nr:D-Ala-D-Ala carboxypeptidase family metallohydrolase [Bacteroidales bacterium]